VDIRSEKLAKVQIHMAKAHDTPSATATAHSPAPWRSYKSDDGKVIEIGASGADHIWLVATLPEPRDGDLRLEQAANARLITASPDLLEACEFTIDLLDHLSSADFARGGDREARLKLMAAVAKARGQAAC